MFLPWIKVFGYGISLYNIITGAKTGNYTVSYSSMSQAGASISYLLLTSVILYVVSLITLLIGLVNEKGLIIGGLSGIFSGITWIIAIDYMKKMLMQQAQTSQNPFQQLGAILAGMAVNTGEAVYIVMVGGLIGIVGFFISRKEEAVKVPVRAATIFIITTILFGALSGYLYTLNNDLGSQISYLNNRLQTLQNENNKLNSQINQLQSENALLQQEITTLEYNNTLLKSEVVQLNNQIIFLNNRINSLEDEIEKLRNIINLGYYETIIDDTFKFSAYSLPRYYIHYFPYTGYLEIHISTGGKIKITISQYYRGYDYTVEMTVMSGEYIMPVLPGSISIKLEYLENYPTQVSITVYYIY